MADAGSLGTLSVGIISWFDEAGLKDLEKNFAIAERAADGLEQEIDQLSNNATADLQKLGKAEGLSQFSANIDKQMSDVEKRFEGLSKIGDRLKSAGTAMTIGVTAPIVAFGVASLKAAGDFESAMNRVSAQGDIAGADLEKLKAQAEDLGAKTQFSSRQAAEGMAELASAGMKTEEIFAAMPGILNLAAAAGTDVGQSAKTAKDLLGQFGLEATDTARVVDVLAKAGTEGSGTLTEMANSLTYVGPVAKQVGMDLEETSAALIVLDQAGIRGEKAGTGLRSMLTSLLKPTEDGAVRMQQLGIRVNDASGNMLPFAAIIEQFRTGLAKVPGDAEKSAALIDVFGEAGQTAASILAQKGSPALLEFEQKLRNSGGTAEKVAGTMNQGLNGALERMRGSLETAAQKIGEQLAPAIISLAGYVEQAANKLAEFAKWFNTLPDWVQNTALAFVALAAAIGPALIVAGQFAQAIIAIKAASALALPALAGLEKMVGLSAGTMGIYAIAIAAAGVAIYKTIEAIRDEKQARRELTEVTEEGAQTLVKLESHLRSQGAEVDKLKQNLKKGLITQREYEQGLRAMAIEIGKTKKATEDTNKPLTEMEKLQKQLKDQLDAATKAAAGNAAGTKKAGDEAKAASENFKPLINRNEELFEVAGRLNAAHKKHVDDLVDLKETLAKVAKEGVPMYQVTDHITDSFDRMSTAINGVIDVAKEAHPVISAMTQATIEPLIQQEQVVEEAKDNLQEFKDENLRTAREVETIWQKMGKAINQEVKNFMADVIDRFVFGSDYNDRLEEEASALTGSLEERRQEWEDYASDVAGEQAGMSEAYRQALADEDADLAGALADRAADFAEFVTESKSSLMQETRDLNRELGERVADYEDFAEETAEALEAAGRKHMETYQKETDSLFEQLRERSEDYDDWVDDANESLSRLGRKYSENIEDETRDTGRNIRDRQKDYDRYAEDVADKIAELRQENNGQYSEEEDDLRRSLARKKEDLDQYIADEQEDLRLYTEAQRAQQAQEEADLRESMERKKRDHDQYVEAIRTKLRDAQQEYQTGLATETAALQTSLADRKLKLDQFTIETDEKLKEITAAHDRELAIEKAAYDKFVADAVAASELRKTEITADFQGESSALETELGKQRAAYDAFVLDIAGPGGKLEQLREAHRTIWDDIATIAKGSLGSIAASILNIAGEEVLGVLAKQLGKVFGIAAEAGSSVAGSVAGAAGGAGQAASAAGAAAGMGLSAVVGMVSGVVSAISGVISNFQMAKMETTLNSIDKNTLNAQMYLGERGDGGIVTASLKTVEALGYVNASLDDIRRRMQDEIQPVLNTLSGWLTDTFNSIFWGSKAEQAVEGTINSIKGLMDLNRTDLASIRSMMSTGGNWTVTFAGDPIAAQVGNEIMRQLRLQGVNLVPGR